MSRPQRWEGDERMHVMSPCKSVTRRSEQAVASIRTQAAFYHAIVAPFESRPGPSYSEGQRSTSRRPPTDPSRSYLLELPAELRVRIYEYVLTRRVPICLTGRETHTFALPSILRASKLVRHEALPVYYSRNDFQVRLRTRDLEALTRWLERTTKLYGSRPFKSLHFKLQYGGFGCAFKVFGLMDLIRKGELELGECRGPIFSPVGEHDGDGLTNAMHDVALVAAGFDLRSRSSGKLLKCMERIFEEHVRLGKPRKRQARLAQIRQQSAELRVKIQAKPAKQAKSMTSCSEEVVPC